MARKKRVTPKGDKFKRFWVKLTTWLDNLPTTVKIILYRALALLLTALSNDLLKLEIDPRVYLIIVADAGYNVITHYIGFLTNKITNLKELKKKYSDQLTLG